MREKYESLALVQLKELAKVRGIKGVSTMKKAEVVEAMLAEDEKDKAKEEAAKTAEKPVDKPVEKAEAVRTESARSAEGEQSAKPVRLNEAYDSTQYPVELDSGIEAEGILEVMPDGYGFIRSDNYLPGSEDV